MTKSVNVLGVGISVLNLPTALAAIAAAVRTRRKGYICVTGVHGVIEAQADENFRSILNDAFLCTPDGMPMVWMGKIRGHAEMRRVYGPDLMLDVCAWSENNPAAAIFFSAARTAWRKMLRDKLTARFPKLRLPAATRRRSARSTRRRKKHLQEIVRAAKPDILWVGLSTPKQEKFMVEFLPKLDVTLMVGVGAAFDFHSRARPAGAALDAAQRAGMVLPPALRAAPAGQTLPEKQSAVPVENRRPAFRLEKISAGMSRTVFVWEIMIFPAPRRTPPTSRCNAAWRCIFAGTAA